MMTVRRRNRLIRRRVDEIYARPGGEAGCCLHIVTDDRNYGDSALVVCAAAAAKARHAICSWVAETLFTVPVRKRAAIFRLRPPR